jgi:hypothetical protein
MNSAKIGIDQAQDIVIELFDFFDPGHCSRRPRLWVVDEEEPDFNERRGATNTLAMPLFNPVCQS